MAHFVPSGQMVMISTSSVCKDLGDGALHRLTMPIETTTEIGELRRTYPEALRACQSLSAVSCSHSYASLSYHCGVPSSSNSDWSHCASMHEALVMSQIEQQQPKKDARVQRVVNMLADIGVAIALTGPGKSTIGGLATHYGMRMLDLADVGAATERPPTLVGSRRTMLHLSDGDRLGSHTAKSMARLISIELRPRKQTILWRLAARKGSARGGSPVGKVRTQLDEWYASPDPSHADVLVASEGCAEQVLMDVCTAAILWLAEAAKEAARMCLQHGYHALRWSGGRNHSHAAWLRAMAGCATAKRASRFLRMSDEYEIDMGQLTRSAALLERPVLHHRPTRIVGIVWGCARALWSRMVDFVQDAVAPGKVSAGCALRFASSDALEHFVRSVYATEQLSPRGIPLKLQGLAACTREVLVLNISVAYPLFRAKGRVNGSVGPDISIVMEDLKFRVRAHFGPQIANYTHDISLHLGDNEAVHTRHVDSILCHLGAPGACGNWRLGWLKQLSSVGGLSMSQASFGTTSMTTQSAGSIKYTATNQRKHSDGRVVLITGASRSGKTTLAKAIVRHYGNTSSKRVEQDKYRNSSAAPAMVDGRRCLDGANYTDWNRFEQAVNMATRWASLVLVEGYTVCAAPLSLMRMADAVVIVESTIDQCIAKRMKQNSYPTRKENGEEGWPDAQSFVLRCVWPKHEEYMVALPRLCATIPAIIIHASSTVKTRLDQVVDAMTRILQ